MADRQAPFFMGTSDDPYQGSTITKIIAGAVSIDHHSIGPAGTSAHTATVVGLDTGMKVLVLAQAVTANEICVPAGARCSAANTLEVTMANPSAGAEDMTAASYAYFAWK